MPITIGKGFLKSEMFPQRTISQRSFFSLLWEKIKDFFCDTRRSAADQYLKELCDLTSPPGAQRLFDLFCALYKLSSPACKEKFHFQHYQDAECQYTNLYIKDGAEIPLCIVIRRDHYYYNVKGKTVICIDTYPVPLKTYPDVNIKASTYVCEPLCCLFPERLLLLLPGDLTFSIDLSEIKETLIGMVENGELYHWKEQERKAAISSRINAGIVQAGVTAIDEATKNTIASRIIEATNLKNASFDANYTQSSITQMVYSCLFKSNILMNMLDEQSCHDLLCLNDLTEYVALQIHNCLFSEDLSSLVEIAQNETHHQR
ncbi:TPA: SPI-2 type III secretion system effector SifB [Salmonella enterica subsp. indica]|uniref:SPI-2 type III secretion system effector SifB n=1 Tax=Salmonella enterica subsp. arizonae TaxID=59203 RepID=A0A5Y2QG97_SALER|nr:SPI-2 type III secretion system effector SifB [Salmonella enterica subsp. arizonae]ECI9859790.1 SPI-2 type III secretion system effector SifB [Salmonella enterica subsp. arizonae]HAE8194259.1 SPI-2 type III secretion system effector SifB [Salmonella enterica subsp. indica serovar 41:b:1,7]HAU3218562.1 SPI-2 type III secretion system effector SifB [Salmonella enterica subsp. indica]